MSKLCKTIRSLSLLLLLSLPACTPRAASPTPTTTRYARLTPYTSPSPSATLVSVTPHPTQPAIPTQTPLPSPTPFIYTIVAGDTLGGLALRYGSTISDIESANPDIDPNILTIGMTVTIPISGPDVTPTIIPTPAPVGVELAAPTCYKTADGGAWCLALAHNPLPVAVENLSAWISLQTADTSANGPMPGGTAYAPLNLLPAGKSIPLMQFFPAPLPETFTPQAEILTALPAVITLTRYITATVQVEEVAIAHLQADVRGQVRFDVSAPPVALISLAAIAYNTAAQPVGVVKWELAGDPLPASGVPFQVTVFSLGPNIARVEVFAEAFPVSSATTNP